MKVGDYVRTRWGCIAKFEGIHESFYEFDNIIMDESSAVREELFVDILEKSSPNIIDLIEVGDYVNDYLITKKYMFGNLGLTHWVLETPTGSLVERQIVSIVTKEQFESMEYRIGE